MIGDRLASSLVTTLRASGAFANCSASSERSWDSLTSDRNSSDVLSDETATYTQSTFGLTFTAPEGRRGQFFADVTFVPGDKVQLS